jgi:hypothetical protein
MSTKHQRAAAQFTESNRRAAAVILANPAKYGGDGAAMVEWARAVLADKAQTADGTLYAPASEAYD